MRALALRLLPLVAERDRVGIGDVVREFGASRATAYRALRLLEEEGYVLLRESGRGYCPGPALLRLLEVPAIAVGTRRRWGSALSVVRDATDETVHAAVLTGTQILVVDGRGSAQAQNIGSRIGMTAPANAMAAGKLLLAALDDRLIGHIMPRVDLPQRTRKTISSADELLAELHRVRRDGYASAIQESESGIDSVALPFDGEGIKERSALVVSVPSERGGARRLRQLGAIASAEIRRLADEGAIRPWRYGERRTQTARSEGG